MNVYTAGLVGIESRQVAITALIEGGPESFKILGLGDAAARESRIRVLSSLHAIGVRIDCSVTVRVEGCEGSASSFDLAIACAVLASLEKVSTERLERTMIVGELSLSGEIRPVRGVLAHLRQTQCPDAIVPSANHNAARLSARSPYVASHLRDVVEFLSGKSSLPSAQPVKTKLTGAQTAPETDLERRADEIIATGKRRILLAGPPGSGKMMLARAIARRLPEMNMLDAVDAAEIADAAGILDDSFATTRQRPFRAPHHTVSETGLLGGGTPARPGEVSLATNGTLMLDELTEFRASAVEAVTGALSRGRVVFAINGRQSSIPARPACVIGTTTLCPCGDRGNQLNTCKCTHAQCARFDARKASLAKMFELTVEVA